MATQNIDFDNVNGVTFNGQTVLKVKLNNTTMWEGDPPNIINVSLIATINPPSSADADAWFGKSVSVMGYTNTTMVVGASYDNNKQGRVYVYEKTSANGSWNIVTQLTPSGVTYPQSRYYNYGEVVAVGDGTIVVGMPGNGQNNDSSGYVYIYEKNSPTTWVEKKKIAPYHSQNGWGTQCFFGHSVAFSNWDEVIMGSAAHTWGPVEVWERTGSYNTGTWSMKKSFNNGWDNRGDQHGHSCAAYHNNDIVIFGSPSADQPNGNNSGNVYIYKWSGSTYSNTHVIESPLGVSGDFGYSMDMAYGGTSPFLVVGNDSGRAVTVYRINGTTAAPTLKSTLDENLDASSRYGRDVATYDNYIAVGAPGIGKVFVYEKSTFNDTWSWAATIKDPTGATDSSNFFGGSVHLWQPAGGTIKLYVGAYTNGKGVVYEYSLP